MPDNSYQAKVYMEQGASALVVKSGGKIRVESGGNLDLSTAVGSITFATGEIAAADLAGNLSSGTIDLGVHLWNAREISSGENFSSGSTAPTMFFEGILGVDTTPAFTINSTADQSFYLNWASANIDTIKLPPIAMPADFSTAGGLRVEVFGRSFGTGSASDAQAAFSINAWAGVGNTNIGATHPDFTSAYTWQGITLASGSLSTAVLNLTLTPQAHARRTIRLAGMRARYTRTS